MEDQRWGLGPDLRSRVNPTDQDVLAYVLEEILDEPWADGYAIEFGVGSGQTARMITRVLPALGFDSFEGLPENWRPDYQRGSFKFDPPTGIDRLQLVVGEFAETLPWQTFPNQPLTLVHFDADLYSSTMTALENMGQLIAKGTYLVFDEFHGFDDDETGEMPGEQRAWRDYCATHSFTWRVVGHGREQWAIKITGVPA